MSKNSQKIIIFTWLMAVTLAICILLFLVWNNNIFSLIRVENRILFKTISYSFLAGVLGSLIYTFRSFYQSIAEPEGSPRSFDFKWIFWYLIRPFTGGIFGFVVYAFARSELIAFGLPSSISFQNNLMFFSLSFLAGFGFHDFAEYLRLKVKKTFTEGKS